MSVLRLTSSTIGMVCALLLGPGVCVLHAQALSQDTFNRTAITNYAGFDHICLALANGVKRHDDGKFYAAFDQRLGTCRSGEDPLVFGVTQENNQNTHRGSRNYNPDMATYMSDYDLKSDLGKWVNIKIVREDSRNELQLSLNTVGQNKINVTGWSLQFGHLYARFRDNVSATLNRSIYVDFDIKLDNDLVVKASSDGFSGHRILVGSRIDWQEAPPRRNTVHFMEFDLAQTEGYTANYHEAMRPACGDISYDRCFYDPNGNFAEGREVRYASLGLGTGLNDSVWTHIHIPLTQIVRSLDWTSPPRRWDLATLRGIYIGVESVGSSSATLTIKNYEVYAAGRP